MFRGPRQRLTTRKRLTSEANAGRLVGVFGLRGELKLAASRIGDETLAPGLEVRLRLRDGGSRVLRVRSLRRHQGRPLVAFDGIDDATAAEVLVGAELRLNRDAVQLATDEYFDDDLVGCALVAADGAEIARTVAVEHYPAQDVLIVQSRSGTAMVPLVRAFVKHVDPARKRIDVDLPAGLLDAREADEA